MKRSIGILLLFAAWTAMAALLREVSLPVLDMPLLERGAMFALPALDGGSVQVRLLSERGRASRRCCFGITADSAFNNVTASVTADGGCVVSVKDATTQNVISYRQMGNNWRVRESSPVTGTCMTASGMRASESGPSLQGAMAPAANVQLTGNPLVDGQDIMAHGETRTNVIDILIAVDASSRKWINEKSDFAGDADAVERFARCQIETVNGYYANTGLDEFFTFNLAGVIELDDDLTRVCDSSGRVDMSRVLSSFVSAYGVVSSTWGRKIMEYRDRIGADIVSLFVSCGKKGSAVGGCVGMGYMLDDKSISYGDYPKWAVNVCLVEAVSFMTTLAHEIGHNMGAGHSELYEDYGWGPVLSSSSGPQLYDYSRGYTFEHEGSRYTTIMGYGHDGIAPSCELPYFSSSEHVHPETGCLLGDATHDNTRLLRLVYPLVANYRLRLPEFEQEGELFVRGGGEEIDPILLSVNSDSAAAYTMAVSGLPTGLKFSADTRLITGTTSKLGDHAVKVMVKSGSQSMTCGFTIRVRGYALTLPAVTGGSVRGGGEFLVGKRVNLLATPNRGYVFAGWYADPGYANPLSGTVDYRTANFPYVTIGADTPLYARFVTAADDALLTIDTDADYRAEKDGSFQLDVPVTSYSLPRLTLRGLPSGLKFDAKLNRISGKATKPGTYTVTVSATNTTVKRAVTKSFTLVVPNFESPYLPNLDPTVNAYPLWVGVGVASNLLDLATLDGYAVTSVSGLPTGVRFDVRKGVFSGVPSKAGSFTATITAKQGRVSTVATVTITVSALPVWAAGTFQGEVDGADGVACGLADITTTAAGRINGKVMAQNKTWTFSLTSLLSASDSACTAAGTAKSGTNVVSIAFTVTSNGVAAVVSDGVYTVDAKINAWKEKTAAAALRAAYTKTLAAMKARDPKVRTVTCELVDDATYPLSPATIALTLANSGTVRAAAKYVTGQNARGADITYSASCSSTLLEADLSEEGVIRGKIVIFFPPKAGKFLGYARTIEVEFR